jgi:ABC-type Mn2+/Zn2+ transport system permease subunit
MRLLNRFKLVAVAAVLIALLTAVGGLVISQAAGGGSGIRALVYNDAVRFTVQNEKVALLRAEVFDLTG